MRDRGDEALDWSLTSVMLDQIDDIVHEFVAFVEAVSPDCRFVRLSHEEQCKWLEYGINRFLRTNGKTDRGQLYAGTEVFGDPSDPLFASALSARCSLALAQIMAPRAIAAFGGELESLEVSLRRFADMFRDDVSSSIAEFALEAGRELDETARAHPTPLAIPRSATEDETCARLRLDMLTERELEVVGKIGLGYENGEIASQLHISESTVKNHVRSVMTKTGLHNRSQICGAAFAAGIVTQHDLLDALD